MIYLQAMNHQKTFETPILFLVFNRPDTTKAVLERILQIQPQKLYVVADGARNGKPNDAIKCAETRALFENLPSEIELHTLFRNENFGCKKSVSEGISWFFKNEKQGIILEDDCLPHLDFFPFCEAMLNRYADDPQVMHISGDNFQDGKRVGDLNASYYFSHLPHIWGWATWRSAWELYDVEVKALNNFQQNVSAKDLGWKPYFFKKFLQNFQKVANNEVDTWDYQWIFTVWNHKGISILPQVNLIENIGFGSEATHTTQADSLLANIPVQSINFPIIHPKTKTVISQADNYTLGKLYGNNWFVRIWNKMKSIIATN